MSTLLEDPAITREPAAAAEAETPFTLPGGTRGKLRWIAEVWRPHRGALVFLFAFTLVSSAVAIAYPLVFKLVLDKLGAIDGRATIEERVLRQVLLLLGAIAVARFVAGLYPGARGYMNIRFDYDVRLRAFAAVLDKDHRFFRRFRTGDLVTRLLDDISEYPKISWFLCSGFFRALDSGSKLVLCVGAMFFLDWRLSLLAALPLPFLLWGIYAVRQRITSAYDASQKAISETNDMLEATFSGIRIVKAFRAEEGQAAALESLLGRRLGMQLRVQRLWALFNALETMASRAGQLIVISAGGAMVVRGELTLGTLYALFVYLDMLVQPMMDLPNLLVTSRQAFVSIDRVAEIVQFPAPEIEGSAAADLPRIESLAFRRVTAEYEDGRPVLSNVSFEAKRGETIALVGAVGAGKTSILRVTAGLLRPTTGAVLVNGRPLPTLNPAVYHSKLGYAPQESLLFSESIAENVALGRAPRDTSVEERTSQVLELAQMTPELARMEAGAETVLGQKGTLVSGGQRQRVSIARALYARPEILLLDDCTASLDAANEDRLWRDLDRFIPNTILLLVSHRLATIRRADRIVVLDRGRVVDVGRHEELATRCEAYRGFLTREEERERLGVAAD
ncbi:MAG: ABC transporter ATP-binding protein [Candidatus Eisenbacteria bacterium]